MTREITSFKDRDNFCRALMADKELSLTARMVTVRLAFHLNVKKRQCDPAYITVAKEIGLCERTAIRSIAASAARGWLVIERRPPGRNNFRLLMPTVGVTSNCHPDHLVEVTDRGHPGVTKTAPRGDKSGPVGVTPRCHPISERLSEEKSEGEKDSTPPDLFKAGASVETPTSESPASRHSKYLAGATFDESAFERFWATFPRRVAKLDARKVFERAIKGGTDPLTILAGARRYAAARAAQDVKFTAHPATWLRAERWLDEPAPGDGGPPIIDESGNVVELRRPARDGPKLRPSFASVIYGDDR
jgi:hypothetical protein